MQIIPRLGRQGSCVLPFRKSIWMYCLITVFSTAATAELTVTFSGSPRAIRCGERGSVLASINGTAGELGAVGAREYSIRLVESDVGSDEFLVLIQGSYPAGPAINNQTRVRLTVQFILECSANCNMLRGLGIGLLEMSVGNGPFIRQTEFLGAPGLADTAGLENPPPGQFDAEFGAGDDSGDFELSLEVRTSSNNFGDATVICSARPPCPPDTVEGKTLYRITRLRPVTCGKWVSTALSSPVIILGCDRVGVWTRPCDYARTVEEKTVRACYRTAWDRFWAINQRDRRTFFTTRMLPNLQITEVAPAFSSTPPPAALPPPREEIQVEDPPVPGASVQIAFSRLSQHAVVPQIDEGMDADVVFVALLQSLASEFAAGEAALSALLQEVTSLDGAENLLDLLAADHFRALRDDIQAVAQQLQSGSPSDPASFRNLATALRVFAVDLEALTSPGGGTYTAAAGHLAVAADHFDAAGTQVAEGLELDLAGGRCPDRSSFLTEIFTARDSLRNFVRTFATTQEVPPIPALGLPGLVTLVLLLLVASLVPLVTGRTRA